MPAHHVDLLTDLRRAAQTSAVIPAIVFGAFGLSIPSLARRLAVSPAAREKAYFALGLAIFVPIYLTLGAEAENMRGIKIYRDTFGLEITIVDMLGLLLFATHLERRVPSIFPGPLLVQRLLYLGAMLLSFVPSPDVEASFFSVFKLLRVFFLFSVLSAGFREFGAIRACTAGMGLGAGIQGPLALLQRYIWHVGRPTGTLGSANNLSLTFCFIGPIAIALLLANRASRVTMLAAVSAAICPVLGESRAGTVLFLLGAALVCTGSLLRGVSRHKLRTILSFALVGSVPLILFLPAVINRFQAGHLDWSWHERMRMSRAALLMIREHPWGVGVNNYGWVLNHAGYARTAGINADDRQLLVHNYYYLITAELGYVGIAAYVLLIGSMGVAGVRAAFLGGGRGEMGLGILVAFVLAAIDASVEMSPTSRQPMYALWIIAAVVLALPTTRAAIAKNVERATSPGRVGAAVRVARR